MASNRRQPNFSTTAAYVDTATCSQNLIHGQLCEQCAAAAREIMQYLRLFRRLMSTTQFRRFLRSQPADIKAAYRRLRRQ
jgi:hypothetical protein